MDMSFSEMLMLALKVLVVILILLPFFSFIFKSQTDFGFVISRWQHVFIDTKLDGNSIYDAIEESVRQKEIPKVSIDKVEYYGLSLWDDKRIYLRIKRGKFTFLICAAPMGSSYFMSWWFGEKVTFARDFWPRVPLIGNTISKMLLNQNFFQADTDTMFKSLVQHSVNDVLKTLCDKKGIRGLTDEELKSIDIPLEKRI